MICGGRGFLAGGGLVVVRTVATNAAARRLRHRRLCCLGRVGQFVVLGRAGGAAALGLGLGLGFAVRWLLAVLVDQEPEHGGDCDGWCGLGSKEKEGLFGCSALF